MIDTPDTNYVVATIKQWNVEEFARRVYGFPGRWLLLTDPGSFSADLIRSLDPRYVFFPHWSWKVPPEILAATECVCFHMTDVPFGRGGSPLQNLIVQGYTETKLSALHMVSELDAGPVYMKRGVVAGGFRSRDIRTLCGYRLRYDCGNCGRGTGTDSSNWYAHSFLP